MKRNLLFLSMFVSVFYLFSCQKQEALQEDSDTLSIQEVMADHILQELDMMTEEAIDLQLGILKSASIGGGWFADGCPVITYDRSSGTRVITMDYGDGCKGRDGKIRSGKIIIRSLAFENLTSTREKTFVGFTTEGRKVDGVITTAITLSRADFTRVSKVEEDVTITFADDKVLTRKANLTREHRLGAIADRTDDEILSWGTSETTRPGGMKISRVISEDNPLVFKASCRQIVSGVVVFTREDGGSWSMDYGDGACDDTAVITRNGVTRTIRLKK